MDSSKENRLKIFFSSRLFIFGAIIIASLILFGYVRAYYQDAQINEEIARLQKEASEMEAKKLQLLDVLRYVKSDGFVEEKARTELNMVKPGEQVAVINSSGAREAGGQPKDSVVGLDNIPNYIKWWRYFIHPEEE